MPDRELKPRASWTYFHIITWFWYINEMMLVGSFVIAKLQSFSYPPKKLDSFFITSTYWKKKVTISSKVDTWASLPKSINIHTPHWCSTGGQAYDGRDIGMEWNAGEAGRRAMRLRSACAVGCWRPIRSCLLYGRGDNGAPSATLFLSLSRGDANRFATVSSMKAYFRRQWVSHLRPVETPNFASRQTRIIEHRHFNFIELTLN